MSSRSAESQREASDYAAATFDLAEARGLLLTAARFVGAVARRIAP